MVARSVHCLPQVVVVVLMYRSGIARLSAIQGILLQVCLERGVVGFGCELFSLFLKSFVLFIPLLLGGSKTCVLIIHAPVGALSGIALTSFSTLVDIGNGGAGLRKRLPDMV